MNETALETIVQLVVGVFCVVALVYFFYLELVAGVVLSDRAFWALMSIIVSGLALREFQNMKGDTDGGGGSGGGGDGSPPQFGFSITLACTVLSLLVLVATVAIEGSFFLTLSRAMLGWALIFMAVYFRMFGPIREYNGRTVREPPPRYVWPPLIIGILMLDFTRARTSIPIPPEVMSTLMILLALYFLGVFFEVVVERYDVLPPRKALGRFWARLRGR